MLRTPSWQVSSRLRWQQMQRLFCSAVVECAHWRGWRCGQTDFQALGDGPPSTAVSSAGRAQHAGGCLLRQPCACFGFFSLSCLSRRLSLVALSLCRFVSLALSVLELLSSLSVSRSKIVSVLSLCLCSAPIALCCVGVWTWRGLLCLCRVLTATTTQRSMWRVLSVCTCLAALQTAGLCVAQRSLTFALVSCDCGFSNCLALA